MYKIQRIATLLIACLAFAGCASQQQLDYCLQQNVGKGMAKFLNAKVGKPGGPPEEIESIEQITSFDGKGGSMNMLTCHGTLHYKSGRQEIGAITAYDPGQDQSLIVNWESDAKRQEKEEAEAAVQRKYTKCRLVGSAYETAANVRNAGKNPEDALQLIQGMPIVTLDEKKSIINLVYFNPAYANAGGNILREQMTNACIREGEPVKTFQPLR